MFRLRSQLSVLVALLAVAASDATAEPESGYPTSIVERPMALPAGIVQGGLTGEVTSADGLGSFVSADVESDIGTAIGELSAHVGLFLLTPEDLGFSNDTLSVVGVGARVLASSSVAVDLRADVFNPRTDFRRAVIGGDLIARSIVSADVLVEYGGGVDYSRPFADNDFQRYSVNANIKGAGRAQISPGFATVLDARFVIGLADGYDEDVRADPLVEVGARGILTTRSTDLFFGAALSTRGESTAATALAGISARLP